MNRKTIFKRISLAVVTALGFGVLASSPSQAVPFSTSIAIDAAADSVYTLETATAVLTQAFSGTAVGDSVTVRYTCATAVGNTCPVPVFYQTYAQETSNVTGKFASDLDTVNVYYQSGTTWTDSLVATTSTASSNFSVKAAGFGRAGTYTYNFYTTYVDQSIAGVDKTKLTGQSVNWTVTVTNPNAGASSLVVWLSQDPYTSYAKRLGWGAASDSAVVVDRGTASSLANRPETAAYVYVAPKNANGETAVLVNGAWKTVDETITVEIDRGYVSTHPTAPSTLGNYSKSATMDARNGGSVINRESLTVFSDGTPGVGTLTFKSSTGAVLATKTITFTGGVSSISQAFFVNAETTVTYQGNFSESVTVNAYVKDSAGTILKASGGLDRNLYLYSSDTKVVGDINGSSLPNQRVSTCTVSTTTGLWTCKGDIRDSGTVTMTLRDSITVTASTVSFDLGTVTVVGNTLRTLTATLDKATYAPGERAVLTLKGFDTQGKVMSGRGNDSSAINQTYASAFSQIAVSANTWSASTTYPYCGSVGRTGDACNTVTTSTYSPFKESGMETRVVVMPTTSGAVNYEYRLSDGTVIATVSATVVDPVQDAQNAAIAAAKAEATAAIAAADAATDAALQAIDAANAATDAANLAAEAADAATVAAEEAKDAADAATAAVEALATQVATLMAALQAQVRSLANTVAKIAKKVKA